MADPLSLLRQYNVNKKEIIERDNQIIFGEYSWPKNVKTNVARGSGKKGSAGKGDFSGAKEYYTLECLLFFLKNKHLFHPEYCNSAKAANIPAVWRPDRKVLLTYLNGETATCASIDKSAPLEIPTQRGDQRSSENTYNPRRRRHDVIMADPLSLLRQYNVNKKEIIERDNQIIFGEYSWPKNVKTNVARGSGKKGSAGKGDFSGAKEYYTLECLLFFLKNKHLFHPEYCNSAKAANIPAVWRPDRKVLLTYLNGETATCASIDKSAPLEIPTQVKRTHDNDGGESAAKKPRIKETHKQKVREQPAARLDAPKEDSVTVDNINPSAPPHTDTHASTRGARPAARLAAD